MQSELPPREEKDVFEARHEDKRVGTGQGARGDSGERGGRAARRGERRDRARARGARRRARSRARASREAHLVEHDIDAVRVAHIELENHRFGRQTLSSAARTDGAAR